MKLQKADYDIDTIEKLFWNRIHYTNLAYSWIIEDRCSENEDEVDQLKNIVFFQYYFDISTAIEALLRGISFSLLDSQKFIEYYTKPDDPGKGFFLSNSEVKTFIDFNKVSEIFAHGERLDKFKEKAKELFPLKTYREWNKSFENTDFILAAYNSCVTQRNLFAHGLSQKNPNAVAEFTSDRLLLFFYLFYFFVSYYRDYTIM